MSALRAAEALALRQQRMARIRPLIAQGLSFGAIALATGLNRTTVAGLIQRHMKAEWQARPNPRPEPPAIAASQGALT